MAELKVERVMLAVIREVNRAKDYEPFVLVKFLMLN